MIYTNTNFPILATKRVVVSNSEPENARVKVEFLIKSREATSVSRWFSDTFSEYSQYLNIYFMLLDDTSASLVGALSSPQTRYPALRSVVNLEILGATYNRDAASITFSEVLQNNSFTTTPVTDLSGDYYHDIYSEFEIPIENVDLENTDKLHLIGFIHMDAERYYRDKGITYNPASPDPIESRGGELIYDLLLQRGQQELEVPLFREVLYLENRIGDTTTLEPYYGPAHYHSEESPSPTGYVGWMAGTETNMGPPLESRRIRNYKVVADIYQLQTEDALSFSARAGFPASSAGDLLDSYINSVVDRDELLDQSARLAALVNASDFSEGLDGNKFMKPSDVPMSYVRSVATQDPVTGELTNQESHHGILVGIDFFRLVRDKSNYGDILNFHKEKDNLSAIAEMLYLSKVINLEITRERVTNNAYHYTENDSLQYVKHDIDEPETRIVMSRDGQPIPLPRGLYSLKNKLAQSSTELAAISELEIVNVNELPDGTIVPVQDDFARHFLVKDYDLFHNIRTGKYRHNLDFTIEDGVSKFIISLANLLNTAFNQFSKYYEDAQQPVIRTEAGVYDSGNYDYHTDDFHSTFREQNYGPTIIVAVRAYAKAALFLTGERRSADQLEELSNSLNPRTTKLSVLGEFYATLEQLLSSVTEILHQTGDSHAYYDIKKQGKTYVPASGPGRKSRTLEVKIKGLEIIEAISEGAVLANYSNYSETSEEGQDITADTPNISVLDYANRAIQFPGRVSNNSILPSRYSMFAASPYATDDLVVTPGASMPTFSSTSNSGIKFNNKSVPKVMSSYNQFYGLSGKQQINQALKINSMRSKDNVLSGFGNKDSFSVVSESLVAAGVTLTPVSRLKTPGSGVSLSNPSVIKKYLKEALSEMSRNNCLDLTDELKATLQQAAYNGVSRNEVVSIVEDNYSNLNEIISTIGQVYDTMTRLASSLQSVTSKIAGTALKPPSEKDKFLGETSSGVSQKFGLDEVVPFEQERSEFVLVSPGIDSKKISVEQMTKVTNPEPTTEKYVFLKIQPTKKEDGIISVNDGYLLRV